MAMVMTEPVFLRDEYTGAIARDTLGTPIVIGVSSLDMSKLVLLSAEEANLLSCDSTGTTYKTSSKLHANSAHVIRFNNAPRSYLPINWANATTTVPSSSPSCYTTVLFYLWTWLWYWLLH